MSIPVHNPEEHGPSSCAVEGDRGNVAHECGVVEWWRDGDTACACSMEISLVLKFNTRPVNRRDPIHAANYCSYYGKILHAQLVNVLCLDFLFLIYHAKASYR